MPQYSDIVLNPGSDATIQVQMTPITAIGGWSIQLYVTRRFGGPDPIILQSTASGFISNQSGMAIVSSGNGIFSAVISGGSFSGYDQGDYSYVFSRMGSGVRTNLVEGYLMLTY